jgi:hypothetical protein
LPEHPLTSTDVYFGRSTVEDDVRSYQVKLAVLGVLADRGGVGLEVAHICDAPSATITSHSARIGPTAGSVYVYSHTVVDLASWRSVAGRSSTG